MLVKRYGITACCEEDLMTWDIKKQLMDLDLLNDPSMCKSTLCHCPDPCFVSAIITLVPTCVAPYLIRATLDPLCNPPVVTSVEITVESSIPCYCYTVEVGDAPVILGYIDCCCKDVIQVIEEVTTINMCAIYPPVSDVPSSINVTSSGLCSDLCIAPPPVCICWQVTNTGYVAGLSASVTYIPCDSEVATTVIILGETLNVCSYNMPTGDTINVVNNGPCVANCNTDCQCYLLEFVEPEATFQIYSCKTNTTETAIVNSNGYICSGTVPVPVTPVTGLTITLADPAAIQCNPVTNRCQGVPVVCNCWAIDLEDGQGAIGDCNGIPTNVTNNTGLFGTFYICSVTIPTPAGAYVISPTINALDCSNVASPCNQF